MATDKGNENGKKPFYKKWWFWLIIIVIIIALASSLSDDEPEENENNDSGTELTEDTDETENQTEDTNDIVEEQPEEQPDAVIKDSNEEEPADDPADTEDETSVRDNSSAKLTELNTGTFLVGTDIPAGRYVITGDGNGNLFINSESGTNFVNEILGGGEFGVDTVTTDINNGDSIEISGINKVTFKPAETKLYKDSLTTGTWLVGMDIAPGRYDISSLEGNGNLFVYDKSGWPEVNEILGGDYGVEKVTANLEEGYVIGISGMNKVKFDKK